MQTVLKRLTLILALVAATSALVLAAPTANAGCGRICTTFISASPTSTPVGQNITFTGHTLFGAGYAGTFDVSYDNGAHWADSGFSGTTDSNGNVVILVTSAVPATDLWRFNAAGHQSDPVQVSWT